MDFSSRSVIVNAFGGYDVLSIHKFPLPPLEENVEVKVKYCGLNFADLYTRQGLMPDRKLPFVLGMECSGIITAIGSNVDTSLTVGQNVVCYDYTGGMFQDIIRVKPDKCYILPDFVNLETGAAIFVNYLTAYFAIFELGNLKPNQQILIPSCVGGVGWAAMQLAKTIEGVTVYGIASKGTKEEVAKKFGADFCMTWDKYESEIKEICRDGFDVIIDNQGGKTFEFLQDCLKPLGRIVSIGANSIIQNEKKLSMLTLLKLWWNTKGIAPSSLIMNNRIVAGLHLGILAEKEPERVRSAFNNICQLFKEGKIKPRIDSQFQLEGIVTATAALASRTTIGKLTIALDELTLGETEET